MSLVVGLTGGIASGKTTVARLFQALGVTVIDVDAISHRLTEKKGEAIEAIIDRFGSDFIVDGALNRAAMRELVFSHSDKLRELESILHPLIHRKIQEEIRNAVSAYVLIDCALLVEKQEWRESVEKLIVVDVPESVQIKRLTENRHLSEATAYAILSRQATRDTRIRSADYVITNTESLAILKEKVQSLHKELLSFC